ncbi:DNA repair protein RecN [Marinobacteraceae bacterium S3BR75-40.1]
MLNQLTVTNFAIAEKVELHFDQGMTALTGETGAGKSIALDALALTLGARADAGMVRNGAAKADITAVFDVSQLETAQTWLAEHDLDEEGECILRRVVRKDGRSRGYINGQPCPLQDLKALGALLMDIHSQHQHQSLLRKDTHRKLLDEFAVGQDLADEVSQVYRQWKKAAQKLEALQNDQEARDARLELLRYQVEELDRLGITREELTDLEKEQEALANGEAILKQVHGAAQLSNEGEPSAADMVQQALHCLEQLPVDVPELAETQQMLQEAQIQLQEAGSNLRHFVDHYELDPERLQEVEERLSATYQLARKHRTQPEELPDLHERLSRELSELDNGEQSVGHLTQEVTRLRDAYEERAAELTNARREAAERLDQAVASELHNLEMGGTHFVTRLTPNEQGCPALHGNEEVEFLVSTNAGQPPRSLSRVASGGELSRLSLAIQVVVAQTSTIPTMIFDEVDVGIGGGVAEVVGRLLRQLGRHGQVICVTHLPQVAAQAHQHLFVSKYTEDAATFSRVEKLDNTLRVKEVARMLGGVDLTEQTLAHAQEMYERGQATCH